MSKQKQVAALAEAIKRFGSVFIRVAAPGVRSEQAFSKQEMLALATLDLRGPSRMGAIARDLGVTQGAVTPLVDRLEKQGVVRRRRSEDDRRVWVTELTAQGRRIVEQRDESYERVAERMLEPLGSDERNQFIALLGKLGDAE